MGLKDDLINLLRPDGPDTAVQFKPPNEILGTGLARQAADTVKLRQAYQKMVLENQLSGLPIPTFEEFAQQMGGL